MQKQSGNPKFAFLFGGAGAAYYRSKTTPHTDTYTDLTPANTLAPLLLSPDRTTHNQSKNAIANMLLLTRADIGSSRKFQLCKQASCGPTANRSVHAEPTMGFAMVLTLQEQGPPGPASVPPWGMAAAPPPWMAAQPGPFPAMPHRPLLQRPLMPAAFSQCMTTSTTTSTSTTTAATFAAARTRTMSRVFIDISLTTV